MAFSTFVSIDEVLERYAIRMIREPFMQQDATAPKVSTYFREELNLTIRDVPYQRSEAFVGEALIYPMLREIWRHYRETLSIFSHEPLNVDDDLRGEIDYFVCRQSPLGPFVPQRPHLLIAEAKRDEFQRGWSQALAGMIAAQRLDSHPNRCYYGISTNGVAWMFGKLEGSVFTQDPETFAISPPDRLAETLHYIFKECRNQINLPSEAA